MKLDYPFLIIETKAQLLTYRGDEEVVFQKLKSLGYTGVELMVRNPEEIGIDLISRLTKKVGLAIAADAI